LFSQPSASDAPQAPPDPLRDMVDDIDPDELTPRDALDWLYRLKKLAREE